MYLHISEYEGDPESIFCSNSLVYLHAKTPMDLVPNNVVFRCYQTLLFLQIVAALMYNCVVQTSFNLKFTYNQWQFIAKSVFYRAVHREDLYLFYWQNIKQKCNEKRVVQIVSTVSHFPINIEGKKANENVCCPDESHPFSSQLHDSGSIPVVPFFYNILGIHDIQQSYVSHDRIPSCKLINPNSLSALCVPCSNIAGSQILFPNPGCI